MSYDYRLDMSPEARGLLSEWEHDLVNLPPTDEECFSPNGTEKYLMRQVDAERNFRIMLLNLIRLGGRITRDGDMLYGINEHINYGVLYRDGEWSIHS